MSEGATVKLPGWVRRAPELTPPLDVRRTGGGPEGPDIATLQDPANDVAYKMIGGAYDVLGAEVLGQFVPRVLDAKRWGIYVREAGVAWLCRELGPHLSAASLGELPLRMARCVAAHHYVHAAVEAAVTQADGKTTYLDLLVKQSPRHDAWEERVAELRFWFEALSRLDDATRRLFEGPLSALMARTPEGRATTSRADISMLVEKLNDALSVAMTATDSDFTDHVHLVPCYLVIEPHLPEPLASSIRRALLD
jgi:hypothetical protein